MEPPERSPPVEARNMQGLVDRLGSGVLSLVEQIVPSADLLEDHSLLIGWCLIVGFALVVMLSLSGIARR